MTESPGASAPRVGRRTFLGAAAGGVAALLAGCSDALAPDLRLPEARLASRRRAPSSTRPAGISDLGARDEFTGRDGIIYVPRGYNPAFGAPLLLALHGAGGRGASWTYDSWLDLLDELNIVMLAPDSRAFNSWDLIDQSRYGHDVTFIDVALAKTFRSVKVSPRIAIAGFSDGASEGLGLGLLNGDFFQGVVGFSPGGFYAPFARGHTRAFVSHGTDDTILPYARSRDAIVPAIQALGVPTEFSSFIGGHAIPADVARAALKYALSLGLAFATIGALPDPAPAQDMTGIAAVDSAAVARAAYARGNRALREQRPADARREIDRAASAWPLQPAYVWASAVLAARAGDTASLRARLASYADMGLGRALTDTTITRVLSPADLISLSRRHDANRAATARSVVRATLPDSTFWPEGMDVNPADGRIYVTSVRHGTIIELAPRGPARELLPRHQPNMGAILAVRVDASRGVLWATTSGIPQMSGFQPADSAIAALICVRLRDGAIVRRVDLPAGQHVLGDVALSAAGVFFSDSRDPALYWLRASDDSLIRLTHPLMRSPQGVAPSGDGRVVYMADYSHGLLRIELATRAVTWLGAAPGATPVGLDGIVWKNGSIIAIQNGVAPARVMQFTLDAAGTRIVSSSVLDQNLAIADEPTIGALAGDQFLYVANSQWEKHDDAGVPLTGAKRTAPVILSVPIRKP